MVNRTTVTGLALLGWTGCLASSDDVARVPPEIDGRLTINELMAVNAVTADDGLGNSPDWIELYNPTEVDVGLGGYALTDDLGDPLRAIIDRAEVVPAGGYLLLWLDGDPGRGPEHVGLTLRRAGSLGLARPDGSYIERLAYGEQAVDFSAAREPDGSDAWRIEWHASPGTANPPGDGAPAAADGDAAAAEEVPAAGDLGDRILGYDELPAIEILLDAAAIASLRTSPYEYVPGSLVYDQRTYGPVGVRLKGVNSFEPIDAKPSFRINIDEYVGAAKFWSLDDLTLNNMDDDYSMMHERLAYMVAREVIPASRANHALVTVNGQPYGLYSNVETVKRQFLSRWFASDSGSLFEATDVDFEASYVGSYELESGPDDRTLLAGLAGALTLADADQAMAAAAAYADIGEFQRFWAMCAVVAQFDSFPYSAPGDDYFVYADPTSGKLWFMPWGMDETFYSGEYDVMTNIYSVMARRCAESAACTAGFVSEVWALLARTEELGLLAEIDRVAEQIAPHVAVDTRKPYDDATVAEFQQQLRWFVGGRRQLLGTMLPPVDE